MSLIWKVKSLHNLPGEGGKVCFHNCYGKSSVGLDQLCLPNVTFTVSLEKQLSAGGRNVRGVMSGGQHLVLPTNGTPVGTTDSGAGRAGAAFAGKRGHGRTRWHCCLRAEMGGSLLSPLQRQPGGPRAVAAAALPPHGPRGRRQERAVPLPSR